MIINRNLDPSHDPSKDPEESGEAKLDSEEGKLADNLLTEQNQLLEETGLTPKKPGQSLWTAMLIGAVALGIGGLGGRLTAPNSCLVNRPAVLFTKDGQQLTGILDSLNQTTAFFKKDDTSAATDKFDFDSISRIVFFRDQTELQANSFDVLATSTALGYFPGQYEIQAGGHKGQLTVYLTTTGSIAAAVQFSNWGNRQIEALSNVRVIGNRIDFRRSCSGQECRRIGSDYDFHQDYIGFLDPIKREIAGNYSGTHSSGTWVARRK